MNSNVVEKCLAFCQTLVSSKQQFKITLYFGQDVFNFETKVLSTSICHVKKKTPSQVRREERRRQTFYMKKQTEKVVDVNEKIAKKSTLIPKPFEATEKEAVKDAKKFFCDKCGYSIHTLKGLKTHVLRRHKTSNGVISENDEEVEDSIPQIDGHLEQKSDVSIILKDKETQTEEVKNNWVVL